MKRPHYLFQGFLSKTLDHVHDHIQNMVASFLASRIILATAAIIPISLVFLFGASYDSFGQADADADTVSKPEITLNDTRLGSEVVANNLEFPTAMAFLGPGDIIVLEKDTGKVKRIVNGKPLEEPLLDANVSGLGESGMVGVAVANKNSYYGQINNTTYVFLYYTEYGNQDNATDTSKALGNRVYRYELVNNELVKPKLILDLPASRTGAHNGGKLLIGPDNHLYITVGDMRIRSDVVNTKAQNNKTGPDPDGTGSILRVTLDGEPVLGAAEEQKNGENDKRALLGAEYPLDMYYAYGIRNSFGMDFDPLTGKLWDTENGPSKHDEINLVEPGFNSGWVVIKGIGLNKDNFNETDLVNFNGKGKYSDPEFTWVDTVAPTAIKFFNSDKYGKEYENDMFVGDFEDGRLYHFDLVNERTELLLEGRLEDKIAKEEDDAQKSIIGQGPGGIVDMQVGPDGYLYIISLFATQSDCDKARDKNSVAGCEIPGSTLKGAIFKITSKYEDD